ncbi:hypothetical protein Tco_0727690 [Tanacetum coccineum]|uniref:Zinc finger, CCHC-type n=1 Tax=Tanacetum coccineum TaxID=301880 RepID=A0ABQ4YIZ9_9ASTR
MLQELRSMFEKQTGVERFDLIQTFHACKQGERKFVSSYVLKIKGYEEQLERFGYVLPQEIKVGLILNGLNSDFAGFVRNYNMHNMGKIIGELHALLIEYEKGLPKKAGTPQVLAIQGGRIQKSNKKPQNAKGKGIDNLRFHEDRPVIRFTVTCLFSLSDGLTEDNTIRVNQLVPSCFVIFDLEPLSFSSDLVFLLTISLDNLCLDNLDIFKGDLENQSCESRFNLRRISLTGFPAQSVRSSNTDALDSPYLLVLVTGTSQSRQHFDTSLIHIESRKSPTAVLFDVDTKRISIRHCEY